jgi:hypothetical protein
VWIFVRVFVFYIGVNPHRNCSSLRNSSLLSSSLSAYYSRVFRGWGQRFKPGSYLATGRCAKKWLRHSHTELRQTRKITMPCRGLTVAIYILCIEHLRMLRLSRESNRDLLHCRRTLYAKNHSNGVLVDIRNLSLCCYSHIYNKLRHFRQWATLHPAMSHFTPKKSYASPGNKILYTHHIEQRQARQWAKPHPAKRYPIPAN